MTDSLLAGTASFFVISDESFSLKMARLVAVGNLNRGDRLALPHPAEPQLRCM